MQRITATVKTGSVLYALTWNMARKRSYAITAADGKSKLILNVQELPETAHGMP
jgi:hypothetical protein